ncbi:unnamed protein product [Calypogeia fissa]
MAAVKQQQRQQLETQAAALQKLQKDISKNHQQDLVEARTNVKKRIEYIAAELKRLDGALKNLEEQSNSKREEVMKLQQRLAN